MFLIVSIILIIPLIFYLFGLLTEDTPSSSAENKKMSDKNPSSSSKTKEKTVIVTEAGKNKMPPKAVADNIRDAIKQGNHSTSYMSLNKTSKESQEDEKLLKTLTETAKKQESSGVRKEEKNSRNPVRYFDESTPRDRSSDALYVYLVEVSGAIWPKLCIQSIGNRTLAISGFRVKADGKTFTLTPSAIKTEKMKDKVCQYYDAPIDQQSYAVVQALLKSRKASLVSMETKGERTRDITETEIKGLNRILETYAALGGHFEFINPAGSGKERVKRAGNK